MKKNATPLLSATWSKDLPDGLAGAKELEKALSDYESARKALEKTGSDDAHLATLKALGAIDAAGKRAQTEAEKALKNPPKDPKKAKFDADDFQNTVDALKKLGKVIEGARKEADGLRKDDESDEDDKTLLTDSKAYHSYLKKMLKRAQQGPINFAIGLGKKPEETRILFHKAKPGKALVSAIKQETDLKRMTWGIAGAHGEKPTTLVLALEGPQAPGVKKKAEKLFKLFKPLPFNKIMLMVDGEEVADQVDPETAADDWKELKTELYPTIQQAVAAKHPRKDDIIRAMGLAEKAVGSSDFAEAIAFYELIQNILEGDASVGTVGDPTAPESGISEVPGGLSDAELAEEFKLRLKDLLVAIKAAAGTPAGNDAKLKASEAGVFAGKKEFVRAYALLDEAEALLGASPDGDGDPFLSLYEGLLSTLPGDLARLRAQDAQTADKIQKIVDAGATHAGQGAYEKACKFLEQAAGAIAKAFGAARAEAASDVIPEGMVAAMKANLAEAQSRWESGVAIAHVQAKPAKDALVGEYAAAAPGIDNILNSYREDLMRLLESAQRAQEQVAMQSSVAQTLATIDSLRTEIAEDDVLGYLAECGLRVRPAFDDALDEIEALLQS